MLGLTAYEQETQRLLEAFAALEEAEPQSQAQPIPVVITLKPRKAAAKSERPDLLEKCEFQPDNSRIGCESLGFQSGKYAAPALYAGEWDAAARYMVAEHLELKQGIVRILPVISRTELEQPTAPVAKMYGCETEPALIRKLDPTTGLLDEMAVPNVDPQRVRREQRAWKAQRLPKYGQRPQVMA
jgi:hypothetical protein